MLEAIGENAKRKHLGAYQRLIASRAVRQHARQRNDLAEPASIVFSLDLDY